MLGTGNVVRANQTNQGNVLGVLESVQWGVVGNKAQAWLRLAGRAGCLAKGLAHALNVEASYATTFNLPVHGHGGATNPMVPLYIPYRQKA